MFGEPSPDARMRRVSCAFVSLILLSEALLWRVFVKLQRLSRRLRKIREATLAGIRDTWLPASVEACDNCVKFGCSWPSPVLLPDSSDPKEKKKHVDRMHRKRRFREASVATPNSLGRSLLGTVYLINLIIYYYHIWCHMIWVYIYIIIIIYYYYYYYYYVLAHIIIWLWSHIL